MKKISILSTCILIFVIGLVFYPKLYKAHIKNIFFKDYDIVEQLVFNQQGDLKNKAKILTTNAGYCIIEEDSLKFYDDFGHIKWEKPVHSRNVLVSSGHDYMAIAEKKAGELYILNNQGAIIGELKGLDEINSVMICDDTYAVVFLKYNKIMIFDMTLNLVCNEELLEGDVLSYSLNSKGEHLVSSIFGINSYDFDTKVIVSEFNGKIISGLNKKNSIVYETFALEDQYIFVSNSSIEAYTYNGKFLWEQEMDRKISNIKMIGNMIYYITEKNKDALEDPSPEKLLMGMHINGKVKMKVSIENGDIIDMEAIGDQLIVLYSDHFDIFNESGKKLETYNINQIPSRIQVIDSNSFSIEYMNHMDLYKKIDVEV